MRKKIKLIFMSLLLSLFLLFASCGADVDEQGRKVYRLNESTYFKVMNNMLMFPEQYDGCAIELDFFLYEIEDIHGDKTLCGVRHCSSGYGCNCGKDTVIGFILRYDGTLPEPKNQSTPDNDKAWIHAKGELSSMQKTLLEIYAYDAEGNIDKTKTEQIYFYEFIVEEYSVIEDASNLHYYVSK